jgi:hypothetical protein
LRALPSQHDWSEDEALSWWTDFRATARQPVAHTSPTLTITVDLKRRSE